MRTETEITLNIKTFIVSENLFADPLGFHIKAFLASSSAKTRLFKVNGLELELNQTLKIKNVSAKMVQLWLCTKSNKIIAVGSLSVNQSDGEYQIEMRMLDTQFGKLDVTLQTSKYDIQKQEYIQPDEDLLKKQEDHESIQRQKQQEQLRKRQEEQALQSAKAEKKPTVTLTRFNQKDTPFI